MFIKTYTREIHMMEQITQRIETFVTVAGGCSSKFQGRCELFFGEGSMAMVVTAIDIEETGVSGRGQGTVCITVLVTVLMVVVTGDVSFAKVVFRGCPSPLSTA